MTRTIISLLSLHTHTCSAQKGRIPHFTEVITLAVSMLPSTETGIQRAYAHTNPLNASMK